MSHFDEVCAALEILNTKAFDRAQSILARARERRAAVWVIGNGGSAATASHFANDLVKQARIKAFAVADMTPLIMAYSNDDGFDRAFAGPLARLVEEGDVLVAISCSGNSLNVVEAAREMMRYGCEVIALTGNKPSLLSAVNPHVIVRAQSAEIMVQEDVHSIVCHALARNIRTP